MAKLPKKSPSEGKKLKGINRKSNSCLNPDRDMSKVNLKGAPYARSKSTIKRLQMYRTGKAKRDAKGKIIKPAIFQGWLPSGTQSRVAPHQKWFGNTRVVKQDALQKFQEEMGKVVKDPYKVVMKQTNLPISLLNEKAKHARVHLLDTEPYHSVFGKKKTRKKPALSAANCTEFAKQAAEALARYDPDKDGFIVRDEEDAKDAAPAWFSKIGQSRRIWSELYKVIDSSDVVIQVLDARDPLGTRSLLVEKYLTEKAPHKHLVFVLNKVDLVPVWVTQKWVAILSRERPTMAFHSSISNSFGKGALISLLRQFAVLHKDKKNISVGLIGYPNVGKSSIINTLRAKKVCNVAPIAGETKVWQYVSLMNSIFLIDCPGVVPPSHETEEDMVLKGTVRVEYVSNPVDYIPFILQKCKHSYLSTTYKVHEWETCTEFLEALAYRMGRLMRGGEPDVNAIAKLILNDWQRGKIPYFVPPPGHDSSEFQKAKQVENSALEKRTRERLEEEERQELIRAGVIARKEDLTFRHFPDDDDQENNEENKSKQPVPGVVQNLGRIVTSVRYDADDAKPKARQQRKVDGSSVEDTDSALDSTNGSLDHTVATDDSANEMGDAEAEITANDTDLDGTGTETDLNSCQTALSSQEDDENDEECLDVQDDSAVDGHSDRNGSTECENLDTAKASQPLMQTQKRMSKAQRKMLKNNPKDAKKVRFAMDEEKESKPGKKRKSNEAFTASGENSSQPRTKQDKMDDDDDDPMEGEDELSSDEDCDGAADFAVPALELQQFADETLAPVRETSAAPRYKKQMAAARRKRKHVDDAVALLSDPQLHKTVSAKERRRAVREAMEKNQPKRYYDIVNVKNKNRNKVKPVDPALANRGHTKKVPKSAKKR